MKQPRDMIFDLVREDGECASTTFARCGRAAADDVEDFNRWPDAFPMRRNSVNGSRTDVSLPRVIYPSSFPQSPHPTVG